MNVSDVFLFCFRKAEISAQHAASLGAGFTKMGLPGSLMHAGPGFTFKLVLGPVSRGSSFF